MPVVWTKHPKVWRDNAQVVIRATRGVAQKVLEKRAPEVVEWLRANAKWQDITGETRRTLFAKVVKGKVDTDSRLVMGALTEWFVWLCLANGGKFDVLGPALDFWGPIILEDLRQALTKPSG